MAVPLPSLHPNKEAPRTKGEQMKITLDNMKLHYDQIRRQIFDQCPRSIPPSTVTKLRTQAFDSQRSPKGLATVSKSIRDLLRTTCSEPDKGAQFALSPIKPNHTDSRPVPQTQSMEMQPFLNELAPILKALDTFNWHALKELKEAEQRYDDLESSGRARDPLANVTAQKRSAHHANLDNAHERPSTKRSAASYSKFVEQLDLRSVSFAQTREEAMSQKGREEKTKLEHSSPLLQVSKPPMGLPGRTKSPIPAIKDPGYGNTDARSSLYASNGIPKTSPKDSDPWTNGGSAMRRMNGINATNGSHESDLTHASSPNSSLYPSRVGQVPLSLPTSPMRPQQTPRPSSRDPRLIHKRPDFHDSR